MDEDVVNLLGDACIVLTKRIYSVKVKSEHLLLLKLR